MEKKIFKISKPCKEAENICKKINANLPKWDNVKLKWILKP